MICKNNNKKNRRAPHTARVCAPGFAPCARRIFNLCVLCSVWPAALLFQTPTRSFFVDTQLSKKEKRGIVVSSVCTVFANHDRDDTTSSLPLPPSISRARTERKTMRRRAKRTRIINIMGIITTTLHPAFGHAS